jgi:hypothetical protein
MEIKIPKTCASFEAADDCPFCYDQIYCRAYNTSLKDVRTFHKKPKWCKLKKRQTLTERGS